MFHIVESDVQMVIGAEVKSPSRVQITGYSVAFIFARMSLGKSVKTQRRFASLTLKETSLRDCKRWIQNCAEDHRATTLLYSPRMCGNSQIIMLRIWKVFGWRHPGGVLK